MILHKLTSSPFKDLSLQHCLQRLGESDGVLLTQDAVYALIHQDIREKLNALSGKVFLLEEDADARGIEASGNVEIIDYEGFVELTLKFNKVVSW
ncbi:MAG: sulfurtransferase complex subunit TusB [Paraglaciecola sp.]|uniref:sulfurtransferase complex subunit TusB n=1 Tax=Paraglaciecola sp. TaxID=1920173 RepID=UPI0032632E42